jgi:Mg2+-importing ATPase
VLVIRTRQSILKSRPSTLLLLATFMIVTVTLLIPYSRFAGPLGLEPLRPVFLAMLGGVVALYIVSAEVVKKAFYKRFND